MSVYILSAAGPLHLKVPLTRNLLHTFPAKFPQFDHGETFCTWPLLFLPYLAFNLILNCSWAPALIFSQGIKDLDDWLCPLGWGFCH
jgi:hypothetical protein